MINSLGGRFGGHSLYLLKGKPVFVYNFFDVTLPLGRPRGAHARQAQCHV